MIYEKNPVGLQFTNDKYSDIQLMIYSYFINNVFYDNNEKLFHLT